MSVILPGNFVNSICVYFPDESDALFTSITSAKPYSGIRANTLKITSDKLADLFGLRDKVPWCEDGYYYDEENRPAKSPLYHAGLFYLQEPSAMSAAAVLDITPGDKVLDICAAPGGKTTQAAAKLKGEGLIVANDTSNNRCRALVKNIELMGITNAVVLNEQPHKLTCKFKGFFDKIIIDAPCSGEGMFRRDINAIKNYTKYKSEQLSSVQKNILRSAEMMLKPGGCIVYSTCTFSPVENEMVIGDFLDKNKDFSVLPIKGDFGFSDGEPMFYKNGKFQDVSHAKRLFPHKVKGEGFFIALLKKAGGYGAHTKTMAEGGIRKVNINDLKGFTSFAEYFFTSVFPDKHSVSSECAVYNTGVYLIPRELPTLDGLRVIRSGFYLGEIKKDRFEPSQALAMSLSMGDAANFVDFPDKDENVFRYLRGETLNVSAPCDKGYCLVCAGGYPLGFAKASAGRLKNKYPSSWVMH